jgi:hypothetical protein
MSEKIRLLKEMSIPSLDRVEWQVCMGGNTTDITPKVWSDSPDIGVCLEILGNLNRRLSLENTHAGEVL